WQYFSAATRRSALSTSPELGFRWDRESLGEIYFSLKQSCNEENAVPKDENVLVQLVKAHLRNKIRQSGDAKREALLKQVQKITQSDFKTALKIFSEIELLAIRGEKIIILDVKQKRNLTDSPTYQKILEKL
ncbi:MAG: single-stranded-DNA-specific exonuclease C-terminal domain-containing protein, partial [Candidatus Hinthialibacter sp.]